MNRRAFLRRTAATSGGALVATSALARLTETAALAEAGSGKETGSGRARRLGVEPSEGYGDLRRMPDQRGIEVLALPEGFSYVTFGWTATPLESEPGQHPRNQDGMGSFAGPAARRG